MHTHIHADSYDSDGSDRGRTTTMNVTIATSAGLFWPPYHTHTNSASHDLTG